jgi:hypothetical protein
MSCGCCVTTHIIVYMNIPSFHSMDDQYENESHGLFVCLKNVIPIFLAIHNI